MNKVYGYCRTARAEGNDIGKQIELVSNYCKAKGLDLAVCFCDDGVSAHEVHKEKLDELLDIVEKGDTIITRDFSRFMRNPIVQQTFANDLKNRGIEVVYTNEKEEDDRLGIEAWIEGRWARKTRDE